MADYEALLKGTEAQGRKEELKKLTDYVFQRWEELTGLEAKAQTIMTSSEPRLVDAARKLKDAEAAIFDICVSRIYQRETEREAGVTPDEQSDVTELPAHE